MLVQAQLRKHKTYSFFFTRHTIYRCIPIGICETVDLGCTSQSTDMSRNRTGTARKPKTGPNKPGPENQNLGQVIITYKSCLLSHTPRAHAHEHTPAEREGTGPDRKAARLSHS